MVKPMKDNINFTRLSISLNKELVKVLDNVCENTGLTRSGYISLAIRQKINNDKAIQELPSLLNELNKINCSIQDYNELKKTELEQTKLL